LEVEKSKSLYNTEVGGISKEHIRGSIEDRKRAERELRLEGVKSRV